MTAFCNRISLLLHAAWSVVLYFIIELISRRSFFAVWNYMTGRPVIFLYNAGIIFASFMIVYLFRRRVFWRILISALWLILGKVERDQNGKHDH